MRDLHELSGGAAIELLAKDGDPKFCTFTKASPLSKYRNCNFSFCAFKSSLEMMMEKLEEEHGKLLILEDVKYNFLETDYLLFCVATW